MAFAAPPLLRSGPVAGDFSTNGHSRNGDAQSSGRRRNLYGLSNVPSVLASLTKGGLQSATKSVHGHEKVRTYGHERSALMATKSPQFWPPKVRTPH